MNRAVFTLLSRRLSGMFPDSNQAQIREHWRNEIRQRMFKILLIQALLLELDYKKYFKTRKRCDSIPNADLLQLDCRWKDIWCGLDHLFHEDVDRDVFNALLAMHFRRYVSTNPDQLAQLDARLAMGDRGESADWKDRFFEAWQAEHEESNDDDDEEQARTDREEELEEGIETGEREMREYDEQQSSEDNTQSSDEHYQEETKRNGGEYCEDAFEDICTQVNNYFAYNCRKWSDTYHQARTENLPEWRRVELENIRQVLLKDADSLMYGLSFAAPGGFHLDEIATRLQPEGVFSNTDADEALRFWSEIPESEYLALLKRTRLSMVELMVIIVLCKSFDDGPYHALAEQATAAYIRHARGPAAIAYDDIAVEHQTTGEERKYFPHIVENDARDFLQNYRQNLKRLSEDHVGYALIEMIVGKQGLISAPLRIVWPDGYDAERVLAEALLNDLAVKIEGDDGILGDFEHQSREEGPDASGQSSV